MALVMDFAMTPRHQSWICNDWHGTFDSIINQSNLFLYKGRDIKYSQLNTKNVQQNTFKDDRYVVHSFQYNQSQIQLKHSNIIIGRMIGRIIADLSLFITLGISQSLIIIIMYSASPYKADVNGICFVYCCQLCNKVSNNKVK